MKKAVRCLHIFLLILSIGAPFLISEAYKLGAQSPLITTVISPDATIGYMTEWHMESDVIMLLKTLKKEYLDSTLDGTV